MSFPLKKQIKRVIEEPVIDYLSHSRIVYIQGARQVGKSTLVKKIAQKLHGRYVTFDDDVELKKATEDPKGYVNQIGSDLLIIDEVQLAPELWKAMKMKVDEDTRPGQLLLTGSTYTLTSSKTPDSLAGRITHFSLAPFSEAELHRVSGKLEYLLASEDTHLAELMKYSGVLTKEQYLDKALIGGYPQVVLSEDKVKSRRELRNYVESLIAKDQETFASYKPKQQLVKAINILALSTGQEFIQTNFAQKMGFDNTLANEYLEVFENLFLVSTLQPWFSNELKRVVKKPKVIFNDSGLAVTISGLSKDKLLNDEVGRTYSGQLFETFAINEILRQLNTMIDTPYRSYHYRDASKKKHEIDLILEDSLGKVFCFEFKLNSTAAGAEEHLEWMKDQIGEKFARGFVFYTGKEVQWLGDRIWKVPLSFLWS
ncbi:MAG: ATP-binding protein [Micrococcaceae bacterium]